MKEEIRRAVAFAVLAPGEGNKDCEIYSYDKDRRSKFTGNSNDFLDYDMGARVTRFGPDLYHYGHFQYVSLKVSEASFSGRYGSPALPKMPSTKSRLLTRLPGAKNRISIVFAGCRPVAGHTRGRRRSDMKTRLWSSWSAVNGNRNASAGGRIASRSRPANACVGTAILSAGIGIPPSTMWKIPCVVRRSLAGLRDQS